RLRNGESIAIVSDAGMPVISDPGYDLIQEAIQAGFPVISLPGANAALCALVASGLSTEEFLFYVFLPRKKKDKESESIRLNEILSNIKKVKLKGEFCFIVEGSNEMESEENTLWWSNLSIKEHVNYYIETNHLSSKDSIKKVAKDRNMSKRDVYQTYHVD